MIMKRVIARRCGSSAFSLVEIALALGVMSLCLVSLFNLLPVGLTAVKRADDEAGAANCLQYLSNAIRYASVDTHNNYHALGDYNDIVWFCGGVDATSHYSSLSMGGVPTSTVMDQRFAAIIVIHPPADNMSSGTAMISVAWPSRAAWVAAKNEWINAEGSISTWLEFLPNQ